MELEDLKIALNGVHQIVRDRDDKIMEQNRRHEEHLYLIKVLRKKLGNDFSISHAESNTEVLTIETLVQTEYPNNHVGIQAQGFN